jgi:hypothetical protein
MNVAVFAAIKAESPITKTRLKALLRLLILNLSFVIVWFAAA